MCAVHCVLTGFAVGILSAFGLNFVGSVAAEMALLATAMLVGSFAAYRGFRQHRSWIPVSLFLTALSVITIRHLFFHHVESVGGVTHHDHSLVGTVLSILGGCMLIAFHLVNSRKIHACTCTTCCSPAQP